MSIFKRGYTKKTPKNNKTGKIRKYL